MSSTAVDDQYAVDRDAVIDEMARVVEPDEWRGGGHMRYAGQTITWGEYIQRRHELEGEFSVEPACMDCGAVGGIRHHDCATHERNPVLDKEEMLQLLALRLPGWPKDVFDCKDSGLGWGWGWYDLSPNCEFVLAVPGRYEPEWSITEKEWEMACWAAGEERIDRIAQSDASGDHYSRAPSKYHVRLGGTWVDVYDVLMAFGVTNPGDQHAIKKMLMPGKRGHKDSAQDRREAIQSLERAIELEVGQ